MPTLPDALARAPRPLPEWMISPFWYHFIAGLIIASALALGVGSFEASTELHAGEGPPAGTGRVESARVARGYRSRHGEVRYTHEGISATCEVRLDEVPNLKPGQELPYWIIKGHVSPDELVLEPCARLSKNAAPGRTIMAGLLAVLTLGAGLLIFFMERRRYRLFTHGTGAVGTITGVAKAGKGGTGYKIDFKVDQPSFTGSRALFRRRCKQMGVEDPRSGDTVFIVHDPGNPKRNQIWGLSR